MEKGPGAFRTISEVADDLGLPQHVLRFWETRFPQIKPLKRGGGRRYYRPDDVELLRGVKHLLYGEGYTIKGVQRILREHGGRRVASLVEGGAPIPQPRDEDLLPTAPAVPAPSLGLVRPASGPELWAPQPRPPALPGAVAERPHPAANDSASRPEPEPETDDVPETSAPERSDLAPERIARLRTALSALEECRAMLARGRTSPDPDAG